MGVHSQQGGRGSVAYRNRVLERTTMAQRPRTPAEQLTRRTTPTAAPVSPPPHFHLPNRADDSSWPEPDRVGRQEIEIVLDGEHISFTCSKIGALADLQATSDPEGLKGFY
jgi:hypothetical protein